MAKSTRIWIGLIAAVIALCGLPGASLAAAPANDAFAAAAAIGALPYETDPSLTEATVETDEPGDCQGTPTASVWYAYQASTTGPVRAKVSGPTAWLVQVAVYRADGPGFAGLSQLLCSPVDVTDVMFDSLAGSTYYIQLATARPDDAAAHLSVSQPAPPQNDAFAKATKIASLPFDSGSQDMTAATAEAKEPTDCLAGQRTIWYDFVAPIDQTLTAFADASLAVFTGSSLAGLSLFACSPDSSESRTTLSVERGVTYHFRLAVPESPFFVYSAQLQLQGAPPPIADFRWVPSQPIPQEEITFIDVSEDVAGVGIDSWHWRFDDGSSADGQRAVHRYRKDGSYPVTLDIRTLDGRVASLTRTVLVKTHDVRIASFHVPAVARVGRPVKIKLAVASRYGREHVVVLLYRSGPTGIVEVAAISGTVPKVGHGKAVFRITDRLTSADASNGNVTYRVIVEIFDELRDVNPSDNEATAPPTKVKSSR